MIEKYEKISIDLKSSILQCLKKMDIEKVKSLLVFENEQFIGMITIGDLQRAIINQKDISTDIEKVIDKQKIYASENDEINKIKEKMYKLRAECMPVLTDDGNLVNVYFWNDLFHSNHSETREQINLPVVIMAGGMGTRLRPLTNILPKPLIPLNDKIILELIMDQFLEIGCNKFYLSVNYKYEIIEYYFKSIEKKYEIEYFKEHKPLGTIGSVSLLKNKIETPFFVSNCDIIIDQDYRDVYNYHIESKNKITIVSAIKTFKIPYGVLENGDNGALLNITEKPEMSYLINTGVYLLNPELINEIPENEFFHITDLIDKVKNSGQKVGCFPVSEKSWTDIGDWKEYLNYINNKV